MFKRLGHICIGAKNLNESENFYCNILGMTKVFDFIKNDLPYGFYVSAGETTFIEVFIQEQEPIYERPIMRHFCLEVENIDEAIKTIRLRGGAIGDKKMGADQTWQAWITDPSGVAIEIQEYTDQSAQFNGNPVMVNW